MGSLKEDVVSKPATWLRWAVIRSALGFAFLVAACGSPQPVPVVSPLSTQAPSPISTPVVQQIATPLPGLGGVTGRLIAGSATGPAYVGGDIFLGRLVPGSDPRAQPVVAFSNDSDPKALVNDSDGSFIFANIQPGKYALVVWNPTHSFVVEFPKGSLLEVTVEPNKVTDLGGIVIP